MNCPLPLDWSSQHATGFDLKLVFPRMPSSASSKRRARSYMYGWQLLLLKSQNLRKELSIHK